MCEKRTSNKYGFSFMCLTFWILDSTTERKSGYASSLLSCIINKAPEGKGPWDPTVVLYNQWKLSQGQRECIRDRQTHRRTLHRERERGCCIQTYDRTRIDPTGEVLIVHPFFPQWLLLEVLGPNSLQLISSSLLETTFFCCYPFALLIKFPSWQ